MSKFTVAIAGGGIAGLCLAAALSKQGNIKVDVYEASKNFTEMGVGLTLWGRVWEVLRLLDMADDCIKASVVNSSSSGLSTASTGFHLRDFKHPDQDFGVLPMKDGLSLRRADLLQILLHRVPRSNAHLNKRLTGYVEMPQTGNIILQFADGMSATCDVLIGCDGIRSGIRAQMMRSEIEHSGNQDYARHINPSWTGTVVYRFLTPSARIATKNSKHSALSGAQIYFGKGKHVVVYPISQSFLNVVVGITDFSKEDTPWPTQSWSAELDRKAADRVRLLFNDGHPEARDIIETIENGTKSAIHDLKPLPFYVKGRVALIGDAAHAAMPFVGSGAAYAIEDAYVLARILSADTTTRVSLPLALKAYQEIRRPYGNKLVVNARKATRAFQFTGPEGDDMLRARDTVCRIFEDCGRIGNSGPQADANKAISWLERRVFQPN